MRKVKLLSVALLLVLITVLSGVCNAKGKMPAPSRATVTDMAGRRVSVNMPVRKVLLGWDRDLPMLATVAGKDVFKRIVGWGSTAALSFMSGQYIHKYKEKYPEIATIPDVGSHLKGTFSVERVISLKPDIVILPLWLLINNYEGVTEDIARMEKVGIPTVFIDCWEKPFENTISSTLLMGTLLGEEERVQEVVEFYKKRVPEILRRLPKKNKKPKVYIESGSKGPAEYSYTAGHYAWGAMVGDAGGINIAEAIIKKNGQISPEYLLKTDPDVIIIVEMESPRSMRTDYHTDPRESRRLLKAFTKRPGWENLSAVKNGRVYGILDDAYLIHNIYNFAVIQAFAKWFYPDEFKDLDPEADRREFDKKFLPVGHSGVWMIGIRD